MKTKQRLFIVTLSMLYFGPCLCLQSVAQDQFLSTSKNINPFYVFTEGGAAYMPSIGVNNYTVSGSFAGVPIGLSVSNLNISTDIGYDVVAGFGYSFNKNLALEFEGGYIANSIPSYSGSADLTVSGVSVLSASGVTVPLTGASITQIPLSLNLVISNPDLSFRPMVGIGFGVCPTTLNLGTYRWDLSSVGAGVYDIEMGSYSACPFMVKLKTGIGYSFSPNFDLGVRGYVNILTGSNFGGLQTDVYSVVGVNANLTIRF